MQPKDLQQRTFLLNQFVKHWLKSVQSNGAFHLQPLAGDASSRRYFSIENIKGNYLAVDSPTGNRTAEFIKASVLLQKCGIPCPTVYCSDLTNGLMVIEKITPSQSLFQYYCQATFDGDLKQQLPAVLNTALDNLVQLHSIKPKPDWALDFDQTTLLDEMRLFDHWFMQKLLQMTINPADSNLLMGCYRHIIQQLQLQPQVLLHRDYHCKNILMRDNSAYIIDFQDAIWGPISYDIVSLVYDCYAEFSAIERERLCSQFAKQLLEHRLIDNTAIEQFPQWIQWTMIQRTLKVIGIFSRLYIRDNKSHYLQYIDNLMNRLLQHCSTLPQLVPLATFVNSQVSSQWLTSPHRIQANDIVQVNFT